MSRAFSGRIFYNILDFGFSAQACLNSLYSLHNSFYLKDSLVGMEIVIIPAGVPRKPGMTRDDLFNTNASIVATLGMVS